MKVVEHVSGMTSCQHTGGSWRVALSKAASCLRVGFSAVEEREIVETVSAGDAIWHRGHLLTGREA